MPRTPRLIKHARGRVLIVLGAGLAIAGTGAAAVTAGLSGTPAAATSRLSHQAKHVAGPASAATGSFTDHSANDTGRAMTERARATHRHT
ncbi:MAG: hypothetical protein ACYCVZ_18675, partial [Streptosporangiaceae bacterium]